MATITEIRHAIAKTIKDNMSSSIYSYEYIEEMVNAPAIIIEPVAADFEVTMARGADIWKFNMYVIVSRNLGSGYGQARLDKMVGGHGPDSIREILFKNSDVGLDEEIDVSVTGMKGYGGTFDWANIPHVGAILTLTVITSGNP